MCPLAGIQDGLRGHSPAGRAMADLSALEERDACRRIMASQQEVCRSCTAQSAAD